MDDSAEGLRRGPEEPARFEELLIELSSTFVNVPPDAVDREIEQALGRVCQQLGVDLAVLWQWSDGIPRVIAPTHVYPPRTNQQKFDPLSQESYPWVVRQMLAGRMVLFSRLDDMPPEAATDRESGRQSGIKSNLTLPLFGRAEPPIGALAFNALREERDWPDALVKRLQLVAEVFTNALARKRHELALRESEARLEAGADLAGLAFYEADFGAGTMYLDARLRDMCGIPPERLAGLQPLAFWTEHLHPDDRQRVLDARAEMQAGTLDRVSLEYRYLHPTLGERWLLHSRRAVALDAAGRPIRTLGVLRDVTERKRVENELRSLSRRLIAAQEEDRALLARELHDDVTQRLAVLAIDAARAESGAGGGAQAETLKAIREGLVRLSEDIHALAYRLHPAVLEELGLAEALRAECERRGRQAGIELSPDLGPALPAVGRGADLCLYRVAQEALSNVIRHAGARNASVVLREMDGGLLLAVRDDGVGFDPDGAKPGRSLGLASMRERLRLVNGTLDVESAPGQGTAIVAWVPGEGALS